MANYEVRLTVEFRVEAESQKEAETLALSGLDWADEDGLLVAVETTEAPAGCKCMRNAAGTRPTT